MNISNENKESIISWNPVLMENMLNSLLCLSVKEMYGNP